MPSEDTKFVNSLFLKNLIENQFGDTNVQVKSYSVEPAGGPTKDVAARSSMNRVLVRYNSHEAKESSLSFVAKIKPTTGELIEEFKKCDVFDKETQIYKKTIPAMNEILKKVGGKIEFAPDLIYSSEVPSDILIFEDLTQREFSTEAPQNGLNFEQSKLALEKLAFFHAASVLILNKNKAEFNKFTKGTFHESNKDKLQYFEDSFKVVIENASALGLEAGTVQKLKTLQPKLIQKGIEDYTSNFKNFQVLNHGDFWTSNILFKYSNGKLVDAIFVDFQNSVVGSPIIDLMFFLTSSVSTDVLSTEHGRDELIYAYHETLTLILKRLDYSGFIPTLNELQVELLRRGALELIYTLTTAPYLRTADNKIAPAIQPALYKKGLCPESQSKNVLEKQQAGIKGQLEKFDSLGLLDWGTAAGKVRGLLGRFQYK